MNKPKSSGMFSRSKRTMRILLIISITATGLLFANTTTKGLENDAKLLAEISKRGGYLAKKAKVKFRTEWSFFEGRAQRGLEVIYPKKGKHQQIDEDTVEYVLDIKKMQWVFLKVTHGDTKLSGFKPPAVAEIDAAAYEALSTIPEKIMNAKIFRETVHIFSIRTVAENDKPGKLEIIDESTIKVRVEIELLQKKGKKKCRTEPHIFWSNLTLKKSGDKWAVTEGEWEGKSVKTSAYETKSQSEEVCANMPQLGTTSFAEMYGIEKLPAWYGQ